MTAPGAALYHAPRSRLWISQANKGIDLERLVAGISHGRYLPTLFSIVRKDTSNVSDLRMPMNVTAITGAGRLDYVGH